MTGAGRVRAPVVFRGEVAARDGDRPGLGAVHIRERRFVGILVTGLQEVVDLIDQRLHEGTELERAALGPGDVVRGVVDAHGDDLHVGIDRIDRLQSGVPVLLEFVEGLVERGEELRQHVRQLAQRLRGVEQAQKRLTHVAAVGFDPLHRGLLRVGGGVLIHLEHGADVGVGQDVVRAEIDRENVGGLDRREIIGLQRLQILDAERLGECQRPDAVGIGVGALNDVAQLDTAERAHAKLQQIGLDAVGNDVVIRAGDTRVAEILEIHTADGVARGNAVADTHIGVVAAVLVVRVVIAVVSKRAGETRQHDHCEQQT